MWIVDTKKEHLAVSEARKLGIPVVAILDTNCDPDEVQYPIPGNDDAIRSVDLLTRVVADAVADGLIARDEKRGGGSGAAAEPMAEWERELLEKQAADQEAPQAEQEQPAQASPSTAEDAAAEDETGEAEVPTNADAGEAEEKTEA